MDQRSLGLPSLAHTMYLEKALARRLSRPPIGMPPALLAGTGSPKASTTTSRLLLDLLSAKSALEQFRSANAEELVLRTSLARRREYLLSSLDVPRIAQTTMYPPSDLAESCVIPVRDNALTAAMRAEKALRKPSLQEEVHPLHSLRRRSHGDAARQNDLPVAEKSLPALSVKSQEPVVPTRLCKKSKCWDLSISFPSKLLKMLEEAETEGHSDIVSFQPDGKSFKIHKADEFAQEVLPKYFRTTRLSSLQKQLSLYGFKRMRKEPNRGAMYHEFFQRDNKKLMGKIRRKRQGLPNSEPVCQQQARADAWRALNGATP